MHIYVYESIMMGFRFGKCICKRVWGTQSVFPVDPAEGHQLPPFLKVSPPLDGKTKTTRIVGSLCCYDC